MADSTASHAGPSKLERQRRAQTVELRAARETIARCVPGQFARYSFTRHVMVGKHGNWDWCPLEYFQRCYRGACIDGDLFVTLRINETTCMVDAFRTQAEQAPSTQAEQTPPRLTAPTVVPKGDEADDIRAALAEAAALTRTLQPGERLKHPVKVLESSSGEWSVSDFLEELQMSMRTYGDFGVPSDVFVTLRYSEPLLVGDEIVVDMYRLTDVC